MSTKKKPTNETKENYLGDNLKKVHRKDAEFVLPIAKQVENAQLQNGFKWICNEKTSKLVHPSKLEQYISDGWKLTKID